MIKSLFESCGNLEKHFGYIRTALNHSNWSDFGQRGVACLPGVGFWSLCGCAVDRGAPIKHTCRSLSLFLGDADIMIVSIRYIVQTVHDIR